jgi:hypothetical protein
MGLIRIEVVGRRLNPSRKLLRAPSRGARLPTATVVLESQPTET